MSEAFDLADNDAGTIERTGAPRLPALDLTRAGTECQSPAVKGRKRCRMHGGTNPGAPKGNRNAWKHGGRSAATAAASRYIKAMANLLEENIK